MMRATHSGHAMPPHTLITCHANADFDAFAALVAAQYLYPDALLFFPGTQERSLHAFYTETAQFMYNFKKHEDIDWDAIDRLVIVDARQRARVSHAHRLLQRENVEVHLWDHHPDSSDDIQSAHSRVASVGAVTTLLLREIRARGLSISCQDATVLGLGIYSDTGSFTFSSTTPEDFHAAAWLREQGMDVNDVADLAAQELTSAHVHALNGLLESVATYEFKGVAVAIAEAFMENYLGDFAYLAHKLMEMERFEVLFALGHMGDKVQVVARSRREAVDVGRICAALGGGGHAYAASASVRDRTLPEARDEILRQLYAQSNPDKRAGDYMSSPPVGIEEHKTIKEAEELMLRFGLKAVPVFQAGTRRCVGLLDAQTASRAVAHGLNYLCLDIYMQRAVRALRQDAPLSEIIEIIVGARQRLVPIVEGEEVVGVVTRTDLINVFMEDPGGVPVPLREKRKERNVAKLMRARLPKDCMALLERVGALGDKLGLAVYVVGGFVRDLLLDRPNLDIDLVVEGNGIAYARELARELGGRVREHQEFLTAVVIFKDAGMRERRIDVATARLEYYQHPAAMPTVELSSIRMDLFRRDFAINALAVRLGKGVFGLLADFFGGQRDIRARLIRVLHTLSFVEDPTRCLRAVRFEQRYAFRLGTGTEKLIKNALNLKLMDKLSGARLFHELKLVFEETDPVVCLERLDNLGILQAIHPQLALYPLKTDLLRSLKDILDWHRLLYFDDDPQPWFVYLLGLCRNLTYQEAAGVFTRLGIPQAQKSEALNLRERTRDILPKLEAWQARGGRTSELCAMLRTIPLEGLLYLMGHAAQEETRRKLSRYITTWRREKVDVTGADLMSMGLSPGPLFGKILRRVLAAKLDGEAPTRESQRLLAKNLASSREFLSDAVEELAQEG